VIVAVELLAAGQLAVIAALAVVLGCRRIAIAPAGRHRRLLLDRCRDAVVEFVGLDDDESPASLTGLRTAEQRSAVYGAAADAGAAVETSRPLGRDGSPRARPRALSGVTEKCRALFRH
jgi:hypothetical protein